MTELVKHLIILDKLKVPLRHNDIIYLLIVAKILKIAKIDIIIIIYLKIILFLIITQKLIKVTNYHIYKRSFEFIIDIHIILCINKL